MQKFSMRLREATNFEDASGARGIEGEECFCIRGEVALEEKE